MSDGEMRNQNVPQSLEAEVRASRSRSMQKCELEDLSIIMYNVAYRVSGRSGEEKRISYEFTAGEATSSSNRDITASSNVERTENR